eukprot:GEMP01050407.1.p1 GENE.GEMP01050407.1~~GEMP01050407.1.p1  ORF type:complete len:318 (+),score=104.32 GEMP01050407.1:183-1136(+)
MTDPTPSASSCLPSNTFEYFEQREQQLLAYDNVLEKKKDSALLAAAQAAADVDLSYRPPMLETKAVVPPAPAGPSLISMTPKRDDSIIGARMASGSATPCGGALVALPGDSDAMHATVRFQKARIVALQEELDRTVSMLGEREQERIALEKEHKVATEESRRLQRTMQSTDTVVEKMRKQLGQLEIKADETEKENRELRKHIEHFSQNLKKSEVEHKTKDARLQRMTEDLERSRTSLKDLKSHERDRLTGDRKETDRLLQEVRKLERQRTELLSGFKKQSQLIDVLKKQKVHLEAARILAFTEEEFIRVLELGDKVG